MSKSRKVSKSTLAILALSLILAVSLVFGATFAWYKDSKTSGENKVTMGTFALSVKAGTEEISSTATDEFKPDGAVWAAAVPNQKITLKNLVIDVDSNVETVVRVKIAISGDLAEQLSLVGLSTNWSEKQNDGYYYYKASDDAYYAANTGLEITEALSARLASTLDTTVAGQSVVFTITVEAAQAGWTANDAPEAGLPTTIAAAQAVFAAVNA